MISRVSFTILLLFSIGALPWWVILTLGLIASFSFSWYYEAVIIALIYEILFGLPSAGWLSDSLWLTLLALVLIPIIEWLKSRLYVFH